MTRQSPQLDLRGLAEPDQRARLGEASAGFAPGDGFQLVTEVDPRLLLREVQESQPFTLEWHVLEAGPEVHRVVLYRAREEGHRSVARFLETDHSRLQTILLDVERLVFEDEFPVASRRCAEFICGFRHHLRMEEDVLLPLMARLGRNPEVVSELQHEHREICRVVAELERAIRTSDRGRFVAVERTLERILSAHNVREEQVLHPMVDHLVGSDTERAQLVRQLQLV